MPKDEKPPFDPVFENMESLFNSLRGVNINQAFQAAMMEKLKQMHKEIGDALNDIASSTYSTRKGQSNTPFSNLDPWTILGVSKTATQDEVKKAWKKRSKEVHPDIGGNTQQQMMANVAYEVICKLKGWSK